MTVARQVITGQIDQHHVFGILFGVVSQVVCSLAIGLSIPRSLSRAGNRVDIGYTILNAAVGLWRRTEDSESAEVEIEEVG